jgi:hypothetical protein
LRQWARNELWPKRCSPIARRESLLLR